MGFEPHRVAVSGAMAGDVEHVLDREGQAAQRAFERAGKLDLRMAAKGVVRIVDGHCGRCRVAGCRDTVLRPRLNAWSTGASSATAASGLAQSRTTRSA